MEIRRNGELTLQMPISAGSSCGQIRLHLNCPKVHLSFYNMESNIPFYFDVRMLIFILFHINCYEQSVHLSCLFLNLKQVDHSCSCD